ncbi:hypothetical protein F0L74_08080 [Chitinophaga agrisoli]|uniref:Uncharacterized protein n=1 Tax=Chitinophaga agrisoli TaxID=2607653 RepID=A0A5B2VTG1_9BACT|nr:hypothetical protein [Chitinophaga agrisoli]KAA2242491.1 hypothetical protein F0L74_08080 [Chitinophaga agrisoli]
MCCGKKRALLASQTTGMAQRSNAETMETDVLAFRYTGNTALTTVGSATGRVYRFPVKGAVQLVHSTDAVSLYEVPNLVLIAD